MEYGEKKMENVFEMFLKFVQEGVCECIWIVVGINKMVLILKVLFWNNCLLSWS